MESPSLRSLEKIRKGMNRSVEKCMNSIGEFSFRHMELKGGFADLYRNDRIHLTNIGLDIFNTVVYLQRCIEWAAVQGFSPTCLLGSLEFCVIYDTA